MAAEVWMAEQERSGPSKSACFEVPAGKSEFVIAMLPIGFSNAAQGVQITASLSNNQKQSFSDGGSTRFWGGPEPEKPPGNPIGWKLAGQLNPDDYPTHMLIDLDIAGTVRAAFSVEFLDPAP